MINMKKDTHTILCWIVNLELVLLRFVQGVKFKLSNHLGGQIISKMFFF